MDNGNCYKHSIMVCKPNENRCTRDIGDNFTYEDICKWSEHCDEVELVLEVCPPKGLPIYMLYKTEYKSLGHTVLFEFRKE